MAASRSPDRLLLVGSLAIGVALLATLTLLIPLQHTVGALSLDAAATAKTPQVSMTAITVDCSACSSIDSVVEGVRKSAVNLTGDRSVSASSPEGQALIREYGITRLPTVVLQGAIGMISDLSFIKAGDALVYTATPAPYMNASTGAVEGLVNATLVTTPDCSECGNLTSALSALSKSVHIASESTVAYGPGLGEQLSAEGIAHVPALILSKDIAAYPDVMNSLKGMLVQVPEGYALMAPPPYITTADGRLAGVVTLTELEDKGCASCYDVRVNEQILAGFGIHPASIDQVDESSGEGQALIAKYHITALPAILISGDVGVYANLRSVWPQVGTVEPDGTYVFRVPAAMGPGTVYYNITAHAVQTVPGAPPANS